MIKFDNYSIRLLSPNDLHPYFELVENNRSRLEDFFTGTVSRTQTLEDTKIFLDDISKKIKARSYFPYIIIENTTNTIVGFLDLKNIDWSIPKSEMGSYTDINYAGRGITSKAFKLFCDYCFKEFKFKKLYLRTHQTNKAAIAVAEKCGFEKEGVIRRDYKTTSGELVDLIYYGRLND
ncbi:MAG: GNAT family protein [Bacteroidota bacterium]